MFDFKVEPRTERAPAMAFVVPLLAVALTLVFGTALLSAIGKSPAAVIYSFFVQPLSSLNGIGEILLKAGPLILIAQGLAIGYRANVWNIGAEGQLTLGAIAGGTVAILNETSASPLLLPAMMLAGAAAGALWAGIAAFLRVRFSASEILTSFMLTSVAIQLLYYLVTGPLRDPMGMNFPQSIVFGDAALFSTLIPGTRANTSLLAGLVATLLAWVFMSRTMQGFRLVVGGLAPEAARYAGYSASRSIWLSLLIGGACAGLAGVGEVAGPLGMLQRNISPGYGYAAIIVAFLGGLHPVGIVLAALLMALLYVGGDFAVVSAGVPNASATILQGMLLVFYLAAALLFTHRITRRKTVPT
jgi:simple sugar transport system permease protein